MVSFVGANEELINRKFHSKINKNIPAYIIRPLVYIAIIVCFVYYQFGRPK